MCGINCIISLSEIQKNIVDTVFSMNARIQHRGPDESTTSVVNEYVAIGVNRLEIVGGAKGSQPIYNEQGTLALVCNGEIYNHKNLQKAYCKAHTFHTMSDVEIILHLYEELGDVFISKLEGQFAFILVDTTRKHVVLGRDRFGILPLFFAHTPGGLLVSSEIKGIIGSELLKNLSFDAQEILNSWFFYGPKAPKTCFHEIQQLPAGTIGTYSYVDKHYAETRYWSPPTRKYIPSRQVSLKTLKRRLETSVKQCLQGSYRAGVYISGGVDSSIIAALTKKLSPQPPILFGIAFTDVAYDERTYQVNLATYLNCALKQVIIRPKDLEHHFMDCVYHVEVPLTRAAPIPLMLLSKLVRKTGVKFVLCGEGADELFLGYPVFEQNLSSIEAKYAEKESFLPYFNSHITGNKYPSKIPNTMVRCSLGRENIDRLRIIEIETKLSRYLLATQGDRVSMTNSVEQRFPYLHTGVVSAAYTLKRNDLITQSLSKVALRNSFKNELPNTLLYRPKKGYLAPDRSLADILVSSAKWSRLFSKERTHEVGIFAYNQLAMLVQKAKAQNTLSEEESRFLIFVSSTHLLYELYINPKTKNNQYDPRISGHHRRSCETTRTNYQKRSHTIPGEF